MVKGSSGSASVAVSDILDTALAGVGSESESSFEDHETTKERDTRTTSEVSSSVVISLLNRLRASKNQS